MKFKYMNIFLGNVCVDVIILDPKWLCYTVMGSLLTPEFIKKSRPTGYYSIEELRTATSWESVDTMLPILESLGLCAKVSYWDRYLFSSNHIVHKSSCGLGFWPPDPLDNRFYLNFLD